MPAYHVGLSLQGNPFLPMLAAHAPWRKKTGTASKPAPGNLQKSKQKHPFDLMEQAQAAIKLIANSSGRRRLR
jgi:hypothetical protein